VALGATLQGLAEPYSTVVIDRYVTKQQIHKPSGQRVRAIHATVTLENAATAKVVRYVGKSDKGYFYTGYPAPFLDYYEVRFADGTVYADELERVEPGHENYAAWWAVDPLKNRVWGVYLQRLIDGLPIEDS
jgi:hypothetical protein